MIEIRFHGRGGQGAVTSAELLARAAIDEGKYAQAFPSFGPERRGAPVMSYARISDHPIKTREKVYHPDIAVVLDPTILKIVDVTEGLKPGGLVIVNTNKSKEVLAAETGIKARLAVVDATKIAIESMGMPITNTVMLGAVVKVANLVKADSLIEPLKERFGKIFEKNYTAYKRAFDEVVS
ncbi:MAG: pyruvate ferredoxin oxidoreductase subunit gamma [Deltaproteobacteria bacterium]|nr:pyruvate ferredoxin oxidoreductase subunit gamma [Deltaproteobacteria bacterium]